MHRCHFLFLFYIQLQYDKRVSVVFQNNAWCDKYVLKTWIRQQWKPTCLPRWCDTDSWHAPSTEIWRNLRGWMPDRANLCTRWNNKYDSTGWCNVQCTIQGMANGHLQENLDDYVQGRITASERQVLFMKWVGKAWEEISRRSFVPLKNVESQ